MPKNFTLTERKIATFNASVNKYYDKYLFAELQNSMMRAAIINMSDMYYRIGRSKKGTLKQQITQFKAAFYATVKTAKGSRYLPENQKLN